MMTPFRSTAAAICIALTVATAHADHYPNVPRGVRRHDRSIMDGMARMTFAESYHLTVTAGFCDCLEPTCDGGFMMSCGGEVLPFNTGSLTAVRRTSSCGRRRCASAFSRSAGPPGAGNPLFSKGIEIFRC